MRWLLLREAASVMESGEMCQAGGLAWKKLMDERIFFFFLSLPIDLLCAGKMKLLIARSDFHPHISLSRSLSFSPFSSLHPSVAEPEP